MSVTIISVGNGGYNLATALIKSNIFPDAKLFVCDTDEQQLKQNSEDADKTFLLDKIESVSSENRGIVSHIIDESSETAIVCATLGGMTGTNYAPLIALEAILRGKFVCTLCSLPFAYEGVKKRTRAERVELPLFVASNLLIRQDNNRLSALKEELTVYEMNKPIIETLKAQLQAHSLQELSLNKKSPEDLLIIPAEYQVDGQPLIYERGEYAIGITNESRIEVFNRFK